MFDPRQKRTLATVFLGMFLAFLDGTVVNLALPVIQQDLQAGIAELQWIVDGYILAYAAFMLTGGSLGDRYGRKRLFVTGLSVFVLASLVCALAPGTAVLVAGRVLQGLGGALFVPGTLAILAHAFPDPRQRAQAIGIWSSVAGLAMALGPLVGGVLVESFGWQSIFLANLPFGALVVFLAVRWLTESSAPKARRPDLPGQVLAVVTLAALVYALIAGGDRGWGSPLIVGLLAVAAVGAAVFVAVEARSGEPMLPLGLFRSRSFAACVVVALLVGFGLLGSFFFLSLFLQNVQGYTSLQAGVRLLPAVLAVSACAPLAGRLAGRYGPRWLLGGGMTVVGVSLLAFSQVGPHTAYAVWWPILFGIGAGVGLTMTPMIATIVGSVPPPQAGLASATGNTGQQVGGMLGIAGLGTVIAGHFPAVFRERTASLGLPESVRNRIAEGAETGAMPRGADLPEGVEAEVVGHWVRFAFVEGMQRALTIAGFLYLAGALLAVAFVRTPRPPTPPQGGPGPGEEAPETTRTAPTAQTTRTAMPDTGKDEQGDGGTVEAAERRRRRPAGARSRHVRTALWIDVPVAGLLLASWFTIPLPAAHLALGAGFQLVALAHLATRPDRVAGLVRAVRAAGGRSRPVRRPRLRLTADAVLVSAVLGVTVSGLLQWARPDVAAYTGLHSFTSGVVLVAVGRHVWVRRAVLLRRLRGRRRPPPVLVGQETRTLG